ncbi:bifunctional hydroxymethylpyrimidine kinase/phosphomethylpyrimidine kinase [Neptuniibacter sp. QD72_48]|uniref:bifunctional hydroxymethylpyrimidine kinase/phosphomethylpyrimidine kinase n=1 Tax=unclassified Neptuniibacter TaxID=2630693 RepID=UPI0039F53A9A
MANISSAIPNVLTIAGSDSGGGAGVQADLKTFSAIGAYGTSAITVLTAQNTQSVKSIYPVSAEFLLQQLDAVFDDIEINAVKTGMLGNTDMVLTVASFLKSKNVPLVIDPVMVSTSGSKLLSADGIDSLVKHLIPIADIITPNLPEAAVMLGQSEPKDRTGMADMAAELLELGAKQVLLKGGHLQGEECPDIYYDGQEFIEFLSPRVNTKNTHGTGCTLAAAITAYLAKGESPATAVRLAKDYITSALRGADKLNVGAGHGPVNHFHAYWS